MKKLISAVLLCAVIFTLAACGRGGDETSSPDVSSGSVANPIEPVTSVESITEKVGFTVKQPMYPGEVSVYEYFVIDGKLAEIRYNTAEDGVITFRVARGNEDISGVYTVYPDEESFTIGDYEFDVACEDDSGYLLLWTLNDMAYSIYAEEGMPLDTFKRMVESIV